jgi:hypothetical protein
MADETSEERALRFRLMQEELQRRNEKSPVPEDVAQSPPGGAFVREEGKLPPLFKKEEEPGFLSEIVGKAPALVAGAKGAERAGEAAYEATPFLPPVARRVVSGGAAILGAGAAATGANLTLEETKRRLGLTGLGIPGGESDSFSESLAHSLNEGTDVLAGETWGQLANPLVKGIVVPYKTPLTDTEKAAMTEMQGRLRGVYQKVTGREPSEVSWNPFKNNKSPEQAIDETAAAARLRAAGLDPREARLVAGRNAQTVAEAADGGLYTLLQKWANSSALGRNVMDKWKGTRAKMLGMAVNDLGDKFGEVVPREILGKTISEAVDGNFRPLAVTRRQAINMVKSSLPQDFMLDGTALSKGYSALNQNSPTSLVGALGATPTFSEVQHVRESLGVMAHDTNVAPAARQEARDAAMELDRRVTAQLPSKDIAKDYGRWSDADMQINEGQFNSDFVKGLIGRAGGYDEYAKKVLKDANAENFLKLEAAAGPDVANNVRASMWQQIAKGSVKGETMRPDLMKLQLEENGRYGRAFLETVMGKDTVQSYEKLADAMNVINERMKSTQGVRIGLGDTAKALGLGEALNVFTGNQLTGRTAQIIAGVLFSPQVMGHIMTNPHAADLATKLAQGVANRVGPGRLSRLTTYLMEATGYTPEQMLITSGMPGTEGIRNLKKQFEEGRLPWSGPSTGSPMADLMVNPAGTLGNLGKSMSDR